VTPASLPAGVAIWLDASNSASVLDAAGNPCALDAPVATWLDLSTNNRHFAQDTSSFRPTLTSYQGMNYIKFTSANATALLGNANALTFSNGAAGVTLFAVTQFGNANVPGATISEAIFANTIGTGAGVSSRIKFMSNPANVDNPLNRGWFFSSGGRRLDADAQDGGAPFSLATATQKNVLAPGVVSTMIDYAGVFSTTSPISGTVSIFFNGVAAGSDPAFQTAGTVSPTNCTRAGIGRRFIVSTPYYHNGLIAEFVAYDRILSPAEFAQVNAYLMGKWSIVPQPTPSPTPTISLTPTNTNTPATPTPTPTQAPVTPTPTPTNTPATPTPSPTQAPASTITNLKALAYDSGKYVGFGPNGAIYPADGYVSTDLQSWTGPTLNYSAFSHPSNQVGNTGGGVFVANNVILRSPGGNNLSDASGAIFISTNAGSSWSKATLPDVCGEYIDSDYLGGFAYGNGVYVYAPGITRGGAAYFIFVSTNLINWTMVDFTVIYGVTPAAYNYWSVIFDASVNLFLINLPGIGVISSPNGTSWSVRYSTVSNLSKLLKTPTPGKIYAVNRNSGNSAPFVLTSTNAGLTFTSTGTNIGAASTLWYGRATCGSYLVCVNNGTGLDAEYGYYYSSNDGATWTSVLCGTGTGYNVCVNPDTNFITGYWQNLHTVKLP
jgi:hypothetical protein